MNLLNQKTLQRMCGVSPGFSWGKAEDVEAAPEQDSFKGHKRCGRGLALLVWWLSSLYMHLDSARMVFMLHSLSDGFGLYMCHGLPSFHLAGPAVPMAEAPPWASQALRLSWQLWFLRVSTIVLVRTRLTDLPFWERLEPPRWASQERQGEGKGKQAPLWLALVGRTAILLHSGRMGMDAWHVYICRMPCYLRMELFLPGRNPGYAESSNINPSTARCPRAGTRLVAGALLRPHSSARPRYVGGLPTPPPVCGEEPAPRLTFLV